MCSYDFEHSLDKFDSACHPPEIQEEEHIVTNDIIESLTTATYLFMSTVVRVNLAPFNHRIMKSLWQKGQFPTLSASTLAWQTDTQTDLKQDTGSWFGISAQEFLPTNSDSLNKWDSSITYDHIKVAFPD